MYVKTRYSFYICICSTKNYCVVSAVQILAYDLIDFFSADCVFSLAALQCMDDIAPCVNNATCLTFTNGTEYCR